MKIIKINNFDKIKLFSSALWLYEFKFQMSGYSTLVQFQSGTQKIRALHYNYQTAVFLFLPFAIIVLVQYLSLLRLKRTVFLDVKKSSSPVPENVF